MGRKPSMQTLRVLSAMLEGARGEHYGLELSKIAGLPSGTIYPMLARLEREGWVSSRWEQVDPSVEGRPRKRLYQLTGLGVGEAKEHLSSARRWLAMDLPTTRLAAGSV